MESTLQIERRKFTPDLPQIFKTCAPELALIKGAPGVAKSDEAKVKSLFPKTYGSPSVSFAPLKGEATPRKVGNIAVVLSGGQAPGGHNVIAGLFYAMKKASPDSKLFGILGGPDGLVEGKYRILEKSDVDAAFNTGGFDIIGSGRGKLNTPEQFEKCASFCREANISSVVIIGGDDSNTNAAILAEYFSAHGVSVNVIGCPKTIDGDLKNETIETSFGFDTATKVYSSLIGNIMKDALSARKYWHFIRLMGRSASHIALECALKTHPNYCIIGEEVFEKKQSLGEIVESISSLVLSRSKAGKKFGVVLVPEGLVEFIPEFRSLVSSLNSILAKSPNATQGELQSLLKGDDASLFASLPDWLKDQLCRERDAHGNVPISKIETEKLIASMVEASVKKAGGKISTQTHFFGYEGRAAFPSNFDSSYCYALGINAFNLAYFGLTGYMSAIKGLGGPVSSWEPMGCPITSLFNIEVRGGEERPVIQKALVDLSGPVFSEFESLRSGWLLDDDYTNPGPIQYFGPSAITDIISATLSLESKNQKRKN